MRGLDLPCTPRGSTHPASRLFLMDRMIGWGGRELSGGSLGILPALMKPPSGRHQRPRGLTSSKRCALPRTLPLWLPLPAPGLLNGQEAQCLRRCLSSTNGLSIHLRSCWRPWASRVPWSLTFAQTLEVLVVGRLRLLAREHLSSSWAWFSFLVGSSGAPRV